MGGSHMKKSLKRLLSGVLSVVVTLSGPQMVFAAPEEATQLNPLVAVIEKVENGQQLNLTEEGTLDWVHITAQKVNRKDTADELIVYKNLDEGSPLSTANDSPMQYTWSDGKPDSAVNAIKGMGVFNYKPGDDGSVGVPITEDAGYQITIPTTDDIQTLTFVSGIWNARAVIEIRVEDQEAPVYSTELRAEHQARVNKYTATIRAGHKVTVTTKIIEKYNKDGNLSLGGIALKNLNIVPIAVQVKNASAQSAMNLTEMGDLDWINVVGDGATTNRKKDVEEQITFENLSADAIFTMDDAPIRYSWNDGTPEETQTDSRKGAVFIYKKGDPGSVNVDITEPAGYKLEIPVKGYEREVTFVSGVWNADATISIILDGDTEPIYENSNLKAGGAVVNNIYTVDIEAGRGITVIGQIKRKSHGDGNFNLQAAVVSSQLTLNDHKVLLNNKLEEARRLNLSDYEEFYVAQLQLEIEYAKNLLNDGTASDRDYYVAELFLNQAYEACKRAEVSGQYTYESNSGLTSSFGWEGDRHAPIAYLDGSYKLRDNQDYMITFGVKDIPGKIKWYNAEGYLPCFISEYSKSEMDYKVENFANKHQIDGKDFEIAYSRMTVTNNSEQVKNLPRVTDKLIALNHEATNATQIQPGETIVREYAIGADRFNGNYAYPENDVIIARGSFDGNYNQMKEYWNERVAPLTKLSLPDERLVNAYKAGFIYTLIVRDDIDGRKQLHVGENGYDIMFDHDTIGIVAALLTSGDFMYAKEYLATLPAQLQYDDAKWKYSWPYALYLSKTGDFDFINEQFDIIKEHTHNVETDRINGGTGIIKQTDAIDSRGYWLIDDWSALAGLSTYRYLCEEMFEKYGEQKFVVEKEWAKAQYDSLLIEVEKAQREMRENHSYPYLSIDMFVPTEESARGDVRDGNWASMFLFGRWAWDGYLFGANQDNSEMINLIDDTYTHGFERRAASGLKDVGDTIYNFGGYPHGYYSSAYNAGYGSSALRGETYREAGIKAYQFMIDKAMSGPFGWWEGVDYPSASSPWDIDHARGGGGSCQHMWGQSTATKVLLDSLIAEKYGEKIIVGRGIPKEWIADGEVISVENHVVEQGKKVGYKIQTSNAGNTVTIQFSGDKTKLPFSVELISFKDKIESVSDNLSFNKAAGTVLVPGGTKTVTVNLKKTGSTGQGQSGGGGAAPRKVSEIKLDQTTLTMIAEDSHKLQATVAPANADNAKIVWSSGNDKIATVSADGTVTAKAVGNVTIKASAADDSGKVATCNIKVYNKTKKLDVKAAGYSLVGSKLTLQVGKNAILVAKVTTAGAMQGVTFASSNKGIATVTSKGKITAKKSGTVKITVTSKDGKCKKVYTVKIVKQALQATQITYGSKSITLEKDMTINLTTKLKVSAKGKAANNITSQYTYKSQNNKVVKVDRYGNLTALKKGTTNIIIKNGTATLTIKVIVK